MSLSFMKFYLYLIITHLTPTYIDVVLILINFVFKQVIHNIKTSLIKNFHRIVMDFGDDPQSHHKDDDVSEYDDKLSILNKKPFDDVKFDFETSKDLNKDLHLLPNLNRKEDHHSSVCKPDGMLIGQDNPFFKEENYAKKNFPPNLKYDVIGPLGSEPNPDIDTYPVHTSKKNTPDFPSFDFNKPNFGPGNPGSFGRFF